MVQQFGQQFETAGDLIEDGRTTWTSYLETIREVYDTGITYRDRRVVSISANRCPTS